MAEIWKDRPKEWDRAPLEYDDPYWQDLARKYAIKHGVPESLMLGILLEGEKTNANLVSSSGAKGPFQFVPGTRARFDQKYGIDPWASPDANAEAAALHLKESLDKFKDKPEQERVWLAAAEYNGGPQWATKYPEAKEYANRSTGLEPVTGTGDEASGLPDIRARVEEIRARLGKQPNGALTPQESSDAFAAYSAYARGEMDDAQRKEYEEGVQAGTFPLPRGVSELKFGIASDKPTARQAPMASESALRRYLGGVKNDPMVSDRFTEEERIDFEREVARGNVLVPEGFRLTQTTMPGSWESFKERFKGEKRATEETKTLPSYIDMPEIAAADTLRGIMLSGSPEEIKNVITSTSPDVSVRQDAKGNYIFKSAMDGKEYAIRPGAEWSDLLRVAAPVGVGLATLPATTAMLPATAGAIALGAATGATGQLGVEALRTATGLFDKEQTLGKVAGRVAVAAPIGGGTALAGQLVGSAYRALRPMATAARGAPVSAAPEAVAADAPPPAAVAPPPAVAAPQAIPFEPPAPQAPVITRFRAGATESLVPEVEATISAVRRATPEKIAEFRKARSDIDSAFPKAIPNADKITPDEAKQILPLMEKYRRSAEAIGENNVAETADSYITRAREGLGRWYPEKGVFAGAKPRKAGEAAAAETPPAMPIATVEEATEKAITQPTEPIVADEIIPAPTAVAQQGLDATSDDLRRMIVRASGGGTFGMGSEKAKRELAQALKIDQESVEAATRLGIIDKIPPDYLSTNTALRQLFQAVRSVKGKAGSAVEGMARSIINGVESYYAKIGAKADIKAFSDDVKLGMTSQREKMTQVEDALWDELRSKIPGGTKFKPEATARLIKDRLSTRTVEGQDPVAGLESSAEKHIVNMLRGKNVTYDIFDDLRKGIGKKTKTGVWADADEALSKLYYSKFIEDQKALADKLGASELFEAAKAATRARKALEDDMVTLFSQKMDEEFISPLTRSTKGLETGQADNFASIVKAVPKDRRKEFIATGIMTTFGNVKNEGAKVTNFIKWYDGLKKNQKAMAVMFSSLDDADRKALMTSLDDTYRVFSAFDKAANQVVRTGLFSSIEKALEAVLEPQSLVGKTMLYAMQAAYQVSSGVLQARFGTGGSIASSMLRRITGMRQSVISKADDLISDPSWTRLAFEEASGNVSQATVDRVVRSSKFKQYASAVTGRKMTSVTDLERFLSAMMATRTVEFGSERPERGQQQPSMQ